MTGSNKPRDLQYGEKVFTVHSLAIGIIKKLKKEKTQSHL